MNTLSPAHKSRHRILSAAVLILLAAATIFGSSAQDAKTNAPAADAVDVSTFPSLDKLPGKVPPNVWTGLANVWARNHARWKTTASNDVGSVVFLGDSITDGWKTLARDFPNMKIANRGIGGDITSGVLYRLQGDVLSLNPEAIILLIGTNDMGNGSDPADIADNIKAILRAIQKFNPKMPVVVCKVMPRSDNNQHPAEKIKRLNSLVEEFVKTEPQFTMCDTWSIYADANGDCSRSEFPDLLHPNAVGYAKWTEQLKPIFAKLNLGAEKAK